MFLQVRKKRERNSFSGFQVMELLGANVRFVFGFSHIFDFSLLKFEMPKLVSDLEESLGRNFGQIGLKILNKEECN